MKKILIVAAVFVSTGAFAQHSLEKIWQSDSTLHTPESVLFDAKSKTLYVSNIGDFQKEKSGFISKLDLNGKIVNRDWVTGLTAAKGLGLYKNKLYAAEQNTVAVIDVNTGAILERVSVEGAQLLNDITVDSKGIVYVSDSRTGKVHRIEDGKPSVYLENLKGPNGLLSIGNDLFILADGSLQKADGKKNISSLAQAMEGGTDGIEMVKEGEYIVSSWQGVVYYVKADGSKAILLDTRDKKINAADIGYDPKNQIVYVPTFGKNMVVAYKLK
jgi:DNA-binding beta-propeller fold protein YncE